MGRLQLAVVVAAYGARLISAQALDLTALAQIPECAQEGAKNAFLGSGCTLTDLKCVCTSKNFQDGVKTSAEKDCGPDDQKKLIQFSIDFCKQAGAPLDVPESATADAPTDAPKDEPKEAPKEDAPMDTPKDEPKEEPKESSSSDAGPSSSSSSSTSSIPKHTSTVESTTATTLTSCSMDDCSTDSDTSTTFDSSPGVSEPTPSVSLPVVEPSHPVTTPSVPSSPPTSPNSPVIPANPPPLSLAPPPPGCPVCPAIPTCVPTITIFETVTAEMGAMSSAPHGNSGAVSSVPLAGPGAVPVVHSKAMGGAMPSKAIVPAEEGGNTIPSHPIIAHPASSGQGVMPVESDSAADSIPSQSFGGVGNIALPSKAHSKAAALPSESLGDESPLESSLAGPGAGIMSSKPAIPNVIPSTKPSIPSSHPSIPSSIPPYPITTSPPFSQGNASIVPPGISGGGTGTGGPGTAIPPVVSNNPSAGAFGPGGTAVPFTGEGTRERVGLGLAVLGILGAGFVMF